MAIPKHKCIPGICKPDESIHCLPDFSTSGRTLESFQKSYSGYTFEIISIQEEPDVTPKIVDAFFLPQEDFNDLDDPTFNMGYLLLVRDIPTNE